MLFLLVLLKNTNTFAAKTAIKQKFGAIQTVILSGTHEEMGAQYGKALQDELKAALSILEDFYITQHRVTYTKLRDQADILYKRFPLNYQLFIQGVSQGSGLSLDDVKILNAMETLDRLIPPIQAPGCAFLSIPGNKTATHFSLIGRNYDFRPPYDSLAKYLTVTILKEPNAVPTAFISIAGEIYCPTCINANGLFMELNNGSPSGGSWINENRQSLLINLLQILQNSNDLSQMEKQLNATQSDYSLIINTANKDNSKSYEFSSTLGMKTVFPSSNDVFVSTNFYLNKTWENIPVETDATTWLGVTRRNNLLNLASQLEQFDIPAFELLMDKQIKNGGGAWDFTIYQLIFDMNDFSLYVKINKEGNAWNKIPLEKLFSDSSMERAA